MGCSETAGWLKMALKYYFIAKSSLFLKSCYKKFESEKSDKKSN